MQRIRASILYGLGSPGVITLYTRTTAPENSASAVLCSTRLQDALNAGKAMFASSVTFRSDGFVDTIDPATGAITGSDATDVWEVTTANFSGTLAPALQVCCTWKTADIVAGRRVAGRTFLGPLNPDMSQNDGTPSSSALTAADALGAAWIDQGTTDVAAVVWKRPVNGAGGSDHVITGHLVKDKFAVLRSRRD